MCAPTRLLVPLAALALLTGCRAAQPRDLQITPPPAPGENAALVEYLADSTFVPASAAYQSAYLLWQGAPFDGSYQELAAALEENRIADPLWNYEPTDVIDRATAGYLIARACDINTGLNWQLTGMGRYAWRELAYRGIAQPANELHLIPSGEFLGLLTRAEDYLRKFRLNKLAPPELPAAPASVAPPRQPR